MRKRSTVDLEELEALRHELRDIRAALRRHQEAEEQHRRLEALSEALIGTVEPAAVLDRAERWATATLGLPCSIVGVEPEGDGTTYPLGDPIVAWLVVDAPRVAVEERGDVAAVVDRVSRAVTAAHGVELQAGGMRVLERSLLPDALLAVPGVQLASRYVPAKGSHDVGGDFYDAVRVGPAATLIVGDVQGKGIEAATLTSMARHTLRAAALAGHGPAELLRQLNRALLYAQEEQASAGRDALLRFVTAAVARLEPDGDGFGVTVARAGQPPPIVVRGDGAFEALEPRGVLLGVSDAPRYETATTRLAIGDTLVLYTDGVIEQRGGENRALSEHHLGMLVRNRRGVVDAESIASLIEETVHLVAPEDIRDDVAILVACIRS